MAALFVGAELARTTTFFVGAGDGGDDGDDDGCFLIFALIADDVAGVAADEANADEVAGAEADDASAGRNSTELRKTPVAAEPSSLRAPTTCMCASTRSAALHSLRMRLIGSEYVAQSNGLRRPMCGPVRWG